MKMIRLAEHSCQGTPAGAMKCAPCLSRKPARIRIIPPRAIIQAIYPEQLARYIEAFSFPGVPRYAQAS
jgi:hypothetical protein